MSRTVHHGQRVTSRKAPVSRSHHEAGWTREVRRGTYDDLPTFEPTASRRTR